MYIKKFAIFQNNYCKTYLDLQNFFSTGEHSLIPILNGNTDDWSAGVFKRAVLDSIFVIHLSFRMHDMDILILFLKGFFTRGIGESST